MRHASFIMFHSDKYVLMNMRKDGRWGFPGGVVEENETVLQAAIRECKEEIDVDIDESALQYGGNHLVRDGLTSHFFVSKVSYETLIGMLDLALSGNASHCFEVNGMALFNIDRQNFYKMNLAPTVIDELECNFNTRLNKE